MPHAKQLVQQGVHGGAKTCRGVAHQSRFDSIRPGRSGDELARYRLVSLCSIRYGEEDRVRITSAHPEDLANLRFIAIVVLHHAQKVGHGRSRGGGRAHLSINDRSALFTLKSGKGRLGARNGRAARDQKQP